MTLPSVILTLRFMFIFLPTPTFFFFVLKVVNPVYLWLPSFCFKLLLSVWPTARILTPLTIKKKPLSQIAHLLSSFRIQPCQICSWISKLFHLFLIILYTNTFSMDCSHRWAPQLSLDKCSVIEHMVYTPGDLLLIPPTTRGGKR